MTATSGSKKRPTGVQLSFAGCLFLVLMTTLAGCGLASGPADRVTTAALSAKPKTTAAKVNVSGAKLTLEKRAGSLTLELHNPTSKTLSLVAITSPAAGTAMFVSGNRKMSSQPINIPPGATLKLDGKGGDDYVLLTDVKPSLKRGASTKVKLTFEVNSATTSQLTFAVRVSS